MVRVLRWNGKDLPDELRELPAGEYIVVATDDAIELTDEEDAGLREALASLRVGKGRSVDDVRASVKQFL